MDNFIIPHYTEGFKLDWTKVIPINYDDLAMYIHPRIAITFEKIWSPVNQSRFSIGHIMESCADIDCDDFKERFETFKPFKNARVKRVFDKKRYSIFFDEEEVEIMAGVFNNDKFTAIINIYIDGKLASIKDMPAKMFKIVEPLLNHYNVIYPLSIRGYREYLNVKKVKIKKIVKGGSEMNKVKLAFKMVLGAISAGVGLAGVVVGASIVKDSFEEITGQIEEVFECEDEE